MIAWVRFKIKNMWVIFVSGLFEQGYVRHKFMGNEANVKFETEQDVLKYATKHRFKFVADFYCWIYNIVALHNFTLRHYSVKKYSPKQHTSTEPPIKDELDASLVRLQEFSHNSEKDFIQCRLDDIGRKMHR
jgi:hypothetical protein